MYKHYLFMCFISITVATVIFKGIPTPKSPYHLKNVVLVLITIVITKMARR